MKVQAFGAKFRSIFSPSTKRERADNFEKYWDYTQSHDGDILENEKNLVVKKQILENFQKNAVRSKEPLPDPELFYRNYERLRDDPKTLDRKTLLLTTIYKFARHEWVGVSAAWEVIPTMEEAKKTTDKISRYHLCEEFCHVRLFHEMFKTFHLDKVEWVPLGKWSQRLYKIFPRFPEFVMRAPAFVSELMGLSFYIHLDRLLDDVFADEPEARDRLRALLHEIMTDELAHIGQRRNFMPTHEIKLARAMVRPMMRLFWRDIPEAKHVLNVPQMIRDALNFDYNQMQAHIMERSWVPSYCMT
jgi:hypothetical protein